MEIDNPGIGAASMAMSFGAKPKLLIIFRWWAILMGLASMAAALHVGLLSFGCYGAAMLLGCVRPLHDAYQFLSLACDRVLARRGTVALRVPPDTPSWLLIVILSL